MYEPDKAKMLRMLAGEYEGYVHTSERRLVVLKLVEHRTDLRVPPQDRALLTYPEIARRACTTERTIWRILKRNRETGVEHGQ